MALEIYSDDDLQECAFARVLLTGDAKAGKTTLVGTTAPGPILFLNCDGMGAPIAAKRHGGKFMVVDIGGIEQLQEAVQLACTMAAKGEVRTVVLDTITLLVNVVLLTQLRHRYRNEKDVGFIVYRETGLAVIAALQKLINMPAHLFVLAHYDTKDGLITLEGKLKKDVPGLVHDRIHLTFDPKKDPTRQLLIGPTASGLSGGRNSDESKTIAADIKLLLGELGISP